MITKTLSSLFMGITLSLFLATPVSAGEKKAPSDQEMQEKMARAKEAGTPGGEHAVLNTLAGNWNVSSRFWMKPGDKAQKSTGTSSQTWVLNGRFLKQEYKGQWMGQPFEGLGYLGYDKVKKSYVSVWMDNMSTAMFQSAGQFEPAAKTIADEGTFSCAVTGQTDRWFRSEWKIVNDNRLIFSMYVKDPEGKDFRSMELDYKRVK